MGLFRAASISAGVYARSIAGNASRGKQAQSFREIVPVLSRKALSLIAATASHSHHRSSVTAAEENTSTPGGLTTTPAPVPSTQCQELLKKLRRFNNEVAIPAEQFLIHHYHHAEGAPLSLVN